MTLIKETSLGPSMASSAIEAITRRKGKEKENMMKTVEIKYVEEFLDKLKKQAIRKAELYDGMGTADRTDKVSNVDFFLRCAIEALGEIASAITRDRWELAKAECTDVAHTMILLSLAIETHQGKLDFEEDEK